ncbi:glutathione S-transferase Y1-like [Crassostrea angulata]|uniref:glutathione S-transferase Y1-like n=1 Tax=Magallana angulata TaxID=2784310 RepID=UPI0022B154E9|nr:glutathione S-transferase Y1-like [Crassostrea angulata]
MLVRFAALFSSSKMSTLGYWNIRGLGQPIRLLLNYVGEEFDDVQYQQGVAPDFSRDAWLSVKNTLGLAFPNLPYYIDGDTKITQSNSILRYIGDKHALLGKTPKEKVDCDMMVENAMDFRNGVVRLCYNKDYEKIKDDYFANVKDKLRQFAGDSITICDFPIYELLDQHRLMKPGILDDYPNLTKFVERFENLPKIKAYMASDKFMARPVNSNLAMFM